jgi:hypothetical protein
MIGQVVHTLPLTQLLLLLLILHVNMNHCESPLRLCTGLYTLNTNIHALLKQRANASMWQCMTSETVYAAAAVS